MAARQLVKAMIVPAVVGGGAAYGTQALAANIETVGKNPWINPIVLGVLGLLARKRAPMLSTSLFTAAGMLGGQTLQVVLAQRAAAQPQTGMLMEGSGGGGTGMLMEGNVIEAGALDELPMPDDEDEELNSSAMALSN